MNDIAPGLTGFFLVYWIIFLISCLAVLVVALHGFVTRDDPRALRLLPFLALNCILYIVNFISELNWYRPPPYNDIARIFAMILSSLLIVLISRIIPPKSTGPTKKIRLFLAFSGITMAAHYLISGAIFYNFFYTGENHYFCGYRIIPAMIVFLLSTVAQVYIATELLTQRAVNLFGEENKKLLKNVSFFIFVSIPLILVIDELRYFFPVLWAPLQEERLLFLPGFNIVLNIFFIRLLYKPALRPFAYHNSHSNMLTKREIQVAVLLAKGAAYKEISRDLCISLSTVQSHIKNIYRKTGVNGKLPLLIHLQSEGLIQTKNPSDN